MYELVIDPDRIRVEGPLQCHIWQGATTNGYPVARVNGQVKQVRRFVYERLRRRQLSPDERVRMDCGERLCIRVDHMRAVLHRRT